MEDYLRSTVTKYVELVRKTTGAEPKLSKVPTPFLQEDHADNPAAMPCAEGSAVECPWCKHSFPKDSAKPPAPRRAKSKPNATDPGGNTGKLQPLAASVLMKIMYAARMARFDLLRAVSRLACYITKWDVKCDKALHRLICYIHSSYDYRQCGWVGDPLTVVSPHVYADADLGGCTTSNRSTGGRHLSRGTAYAVSTGCFQQATGLHLNIYTGSRDRIRVRRGQDGPAALSGPLGDFTTTWLSSHFPRGQHSYDTSLQDWTQPYNETYGAMSAHSYFVDA